MDEIADEVGCKPDFKSLILRDPKLTLHCLLGPCFPAQYRLNGPGKWNGAKTAICSGMERSLAPLKSSNILPKNAKLVDECSRDICITIPKGLTSYFLLLFVVFLLFCVCLV